MEFLMGFFSRVPPFLLYIIDRKASDFDGVQ
jgi:hypothetical protein